jgi:hypothetical protein
VKFPLVESYALEARPPHELVVRIVERTPIGSIQTPPASLWWMPRVSPSRPRLSRPQGIPCSP